MTVIHCDQRSPEWFQARLGRLTGSRAGDAFSQLKKGGWAKSRADYKLELVCERLTGLSADDTFVTAAMQRGTDLEPMARAAYEAHTGQMVRSTGIVLSTNGMAGASVDGDVDDFTGIVEIKCPKSTTHLTTLQGGGVPEDYLLQITHALWVTGAEWCDFVSYDDRFPSGLDLFIRRVHAADLNLTAYAALALAFLDEVDRDEQAVRLLQTVAA